MHDDCDDYDVIWGVGSCHPLTDYVPKRLPKKNPIGFDLTPTTAKENPDVVTPRKSQTVRGL